MASGAPTPGFNADARAQEREDGPIIIGGVTYSPARLTNKRLREVRKASRKAQAESRAAIKSSKEYKEAWADAKERGLDDKEARDVAEAEGQTADKVADIAAASLKEQLPILLRDGEGKPPTQEAIERHVEEDLDQREIDALMSHLLGVEDPTQSETAAA